MKEKDNTMSKESILFSHISNIALRLEKATKVEEIFHEIAERLKDQYPDIYIIITVITPQKNSFKIHVLKGIEKFRKKIESFIGADILSMEFPLEQLSEDNIRLSSNGMLNLIQGGIYTLALKSIPKAVSISIEKLLKIDKVYTMGMVLEENNFGNITLFTKKGFCFSQPDIRFIETISVIGSIALQKTMALDQLKEDAEKIQQIFHTVPMGIGIVSDRVFQEVNERVCEITGYSKEELINQNARLVYPSDETYEYVGNEKYKQLRETGIGQVETQWKCKNGELRSILLRSSPINPADFTEGVIFTALDITEKKEAEKALIENEERYCAKLEEANNAKDKFFSIIAHDLKGPFNSILGFADILNTEYDDYSDEERKHFIRNIVSSAQNTYQLLENLLEWSRAQTNRLDFRPEVLELSSAINDSILLLRGQAEAKDIHIFSAVEFNTRVTADENMVKTITRNLLSNAIKFSRRRGNVRVMERHFTHPETHKEMTEIIVKDDGVGMSSTILGQIFQIDQMVKTPGTDNEKGTGLGLILCRELVLRNGGTIWADSEQGKGSAIHFTLPKA